MWSAVLNIYVRKGYITNVAYNVGTHCNKYHFRKTKRLQYIQSDLDFPIIKVYLIKYHFFLLIEDYFKLSMRKTVKKNKPNNINVLFIL